MSTSPAGYSGTPLAKKLGLKPGCTLCLIGAPDDYLALLEPLPQPLHFASRLSARVHTVQIFTTERAELQALLERCRSKLGPEAAVWVSWPKKAAKVPTDITEDVIREVALPMGFVDIKVCAVDATWSGLKLVLRKALRKAPRP